MALTSKQRAALRSAANTMDPVYQIGKGEIDDTLKQGIADCIAARELIKVKVLENSEYSAREAAEELAERCHAEVVQVIGRKFSLYRESSRKDIEKIKLV
jgi:RNA-binding protein